MIHREIETGPFDALSTNSEKSASSLPFRLNEVLQVMLPSGRIMLRDELALGRRELNAQFGKSPPRTSGAGVLVAGSHSSAGIYRLIAGWACQCRDFSDGHPTIMDIYLPGEIIGLDAVLRTRPLQKVLALTSVAIEAVDAEDTLADLMATRSKALYILWLLGKRQQRTDRLLAAISSLDARGRLATMMLDFYTRLSRRRLITGRTYHLPLTQIQIGAYLGLTVVHVNRVLRSLRDDGIVNVEKNWVTILDLERLARLAGNGTITAPSTAGLERATGTRV